MNIFFVGYPGSGKTYVASRFYDLVKPFLSYFFKKVNYIEMSDLVNQIYSNNMSTDIASEELRYMLLNATKSYDLNIISGVREPHLLDLGFDRIVVIVGASPDTREERYEKDGKTNFNEAEKRAKELGLDKIGEQADVSISTMPCFRLEPQLLEVLSLFKDKKRGAI